MKTVKIVGVPEHFNLPWHLAMEENAFAERGILLEWLDVPQGTGYMCELLANHETDLAIVLTEGIIRDITSGNPVRIIQEYVASPLLWGIHVQKHSPYQSVSELHEAPVAISRKGSGSHLMASVHAKKMGWDTNQLQFQIVDTLQGALDHFKMGSNAYFLWEHFTTKPHVDNRELKWLADFPSPWPCFVLVATKAFVTKNGTLIQHITEIINRYTDEFKSIPSIDRTLSYRYGQKLHDVQSWLKKTSWGNHQLSQKTLEEVQTALYDLKLIQKIKPYQDFIL